jgi:hypothetical protein
MSRRQSTQMPVNRSSLSASLDTARLKLQATADIANGTIIIPSLKAVAELAVQIIDIAKVRQTCNPLTLS